MFRRPFGDNPPQITFTKDWQELQHGKFVPGESVRLYYDAERLPNERSNYNGAPTWSITAFWQFSENGSVHSAQLEAESGTVVEKYGVDPGEGSMMETFVEMPADAAELIVWFMNTGRSGFQYWDSDYGRNYYFRFTSIDIQGENATVVGDTQAPYSGFEVSASALPIVENLSVEYKVINNPPDRPYGGTVALNPGEVVDGRRMWSIAGVIVPRGANVFFFFRYTVAGRAYIDDNDSAGFYAPKPPSTRNPQKYLAATARNG